MCDKSQLVTLRVTQQWVCYRMSWPKGLCIKGWQENGTGRPASSPTCLALVWKVYKPGKCCLSFPREVPCALSGQKPVCLMHSQTHGPREPSTEQACSPRTSVYFVFKYGEMGDLRQMTILPAFHFLKKVLFFWSFSPDFWNFQYFWKKNQCFSWKNIDSIGKIDSS